MMGLALGLQEMVRREFELGPWEKYWYRDCNCDPCRRYFNLMDSIAGCDHCNEERVRGCRHCCWCGKILAVQSSGSEP